MGCLATALHEVSDSTIARETVAMAPAKAIDFESALARGCSQLTPASMADRYKDRDTTRTFRTGLSCTESPVNEQEDVPSPDQEWEEMKARHIEAGLCTL